ncbi:MAG: zinc ABC transporter substrate-binding protein [Candidatus Falkowbacteria bacterium]|nr:MAG: zinc ABC transporter substrate-binding protein [Candidatus Falkowbacteria bacterium]
MKKIILVVSLLIIVFAGLYLAANYQRSPRTGREKLAVVTTIFPLYDFAKAIGGDRAEVSLLLPPGVESHSFEPKPSDVAEINMADIFIYTGSFMEPWAEDIIQGTDKQNLEVVDASNGITLIPGVFHDEDEPAGSNDPHIWLDFTNDQQIIQTITAAFSAQDPKNATYYEARAVTYQESLKTLDSQYQTTLANCASREVVYGGHYAFGYLARRYNLEYLAAQGVSPDAEPTAQDLINLVDQIKNNNIKYVFYEELSSPKVAETIAQETDTKMLLLNAAHNLSREDLAASKTFLQVMEENLNNLKTGLRCN